MFDSKQFQEVIVTPVLSDLQLYSDNAAALLMFTCATESLGGFYLHQVKGPALGVYQMEPNTYTDIWVNFLFHRASLLQIFALKFDCPKMPLPDRLVYDLRFATAMARIHYLRVKEPIPSKDDVDAIWEYYKAHYNTVKGKAKKTESISNYARFIKN